jgi:hypothetical protein
MMGEFMGENGVEALGSEAVSDGLGEHDDLAKNAEGHGGNSVRTQEQPAGWRDVQSVRDRGHSFVCGAFAESFGAVREPAKPQKPDADGTRYDERAGGVGEH